MDFSPSQFSPSLMEEFAIPQHFLPLQSWPSSHKTHIVSSQKHRNQYQRQTQLKVSANFAASQFLQPLTEDSSHFHVCSLSQDLLSASCDLVLQATYGDVSSQRHSTSSNHSTTNIIKTPLLIMVNTICSHEGCKRKPMKHGNGSCYLHGFHRKCSFPQCSNNARKAGMCVQHGSKKKQCSENGCTNNAVRKGGCINHGAKRNSRLNAHTLVIRGE